MARATGFEPATSTVTGWHSNQLSYAPAISCMRLNIHPGFGKSKLNLEKSTKKVLNLRRMAVPLLFLSRFVPGEASAALSYFLCFPFARKKLRVLKSPRSAVY